LAELGQADRYQNRTLTITIRFKDLVSSLALLWLQRLPMRCYFHLVNGHETIPDDTGIEVSDLATAEEMALQAIEDIREEAIQQGASWQGWRLDIVDPSGSVLLSLSLEPTLH
jgi:hypothetical protein